MSLSKISLQNIETEIGIQQEINKCIDEYQDILFSSGAGAGKTYALKESLRHIILNHGERLENNNQSILCITYTNVATQEIKDRLGNTTLVKVSTIHERIWELIKNYQEELVQIHINKIESELEKISADIQNNENLSLFTDLDEKEMKEFSSLMIANKDLYYDAYDLKSKEFKEKIEPILTSQNILTKNVANFKKMVGYIYKQDNYRKCLVAISEKNPDFAEVKYKSIFNSDRLHRMIISHDTLLEYGYEIVSKQNVLKRIIIDKYPYILIDEYQDTNMLVVKIMALLSEYATEKRREHFIGYFGDPIQNIYEDGVGEDLSKIHSNLKSIEKCFNRRSHEEIINIGNAIRNDSITQKSIYEDCKGGRVEFYTGKETDIESFKLQCKIEWNICSDNKLNVLVLTNKTMATYSGFENLYSCFSSSEFYKKNYDQLNTELLSDDVSKRSEIANLLFRIMELKYCIIKPSVPVSVLLNKDSITNDISLKQLKEFYTIIKEINGSTLDSFCENIIKEYNNTGNLIYKKFIKSIFDYDRFPKISIASLLLESLYPNLDEDEATKFSEANDNISKLINLPIQELERWHRYLISDIDSDVIYRTYHGTKGLEFKNVLIFMENSFGRDRNYFNSYFSDISDNSSEKLDEKIKKIRNLLYVSCTRSIKNLRILYLDDVSNFQSGIEKVFGGVLQVNGSKCV